MDEEWQNLSQAFFSALQKAHDRIGNPLLKLQRRECKPVEVKVCKKDRIFRHAAGNFTSARQKVLARLLARLHELRKRRCETNPSDFSQKQMTNLWTKISRSPHFDHAKNLTNNILDLTQQYDECCTQENQTRLNRWKTRMQEDSAAFAWLRRKVQPMTHAVKLHAEDTPSETVQEALEKLAHFWKQIWYRQTPDPAAIWPTMRAHMQPPVTPESWPPLQAKDLQRAAKAAMGKSAGLDGWTAVEIDSFSEEMLETPAAFYNKCENRGQAPVAWKTVRQVHLSKDKPMQTDGATLAGDLRPLSVASIIWRVCAKARFQHEITKQWIGRVMPQEAYGGLPGRGVFDAMGPSSRRPCRTGMWAL